jgi:hypothetical protein
LPKREEISADSDCADSAQQRGLASGGEIRRTRPPFEKSCDRR